MNDRPTTARGGRRATGRPNGTEKGPISVGVDVAPTEASASLARGLNAGLWALRGPLTAFFLLAAGSKLFGDAVAVEMFDEIGSGQWFRSVVGGMEMAARSAWSSPACPGWPRSAPPA